MKQFLIITGFLILGIGIVNAQDTTYYVIGGCVYSGKTTFNEIPCPIGVFFNYSNDTLTINGTIGANCCGAHLAIIQILRDTIFISTIDTGELCTCTCEFCFEIKIPASTTDTIVNLNGTIYNTKNGLSSIDKYEYEKLIEVIPNPFNNKIMIKTSFESIQSIWISDFTGRIIQNIDYSNLKEITINTGSMYPGFYLINLKTSDNELITKIIIKN